MRKLMGGLLTLVAAMMLSAAPSHAFSLLSLLHISEDITIHYRLDITVRVDGQLKHASGVQGLTAHAEIQTLPQTGGVSGKGFGEAVALDVSPTETLYFLMASRQGSVGWGDRILGGCELFTPNHDPVARLAPLRDFTGTCKLPPAYRPFIVRFDSDADPTSIHEVLPKSEAPDDPNAIDLVSVEVTRTDDPITVGIVSRLPWVKEQLFMSIERAKGELSIDTTFFSRGL